MQDKIFFSICFGFLFGALLRSFIFVNLYIIALFSFLAFVLFIYFNFLSKNKWIVIFSIFVISFSIGILRFHFVDVESNAFFESKVGENFSGSGILVDEPDIRENNQKLLIEIENAKEKTRMILSADFSEDFKYGDEIRFSGKLKKPENFITDQGKEFDYVNYLRKDGIFYLVNYPKIEIVSRDNGNKIKSTLFFVKEKFLEKINYSIPEPENLLMGGLILGEKSAFDQSLRESFVNTGTIHIVALSGYNVTIVAEWIMKIFVFLPRSIGIYMGILTVILFVLMTGGSSTAIRAGIMAVLALFARATGRDYDVARGLILAAVLMVLVNPFVLVYDVSFQLSFIATIAVIFFAPRIEKYFTWVPKKFGLRDIVSVTTSAYIFVMPFIIYEMGNFSLVALPANILILPFIPITMGLGFLTSFFGIIWFGLGVPFGYLSFLLLHYELFIIRFFSNLSFASFVIPNFPLVLTIGIYLYFVYFLFWRSIKKFFTNF